MAALQARNRAPRLLRRGRDGGGPLTGTRAAQTFGPLRWLERYRDDYLRAKPEITLRVEFSTVYHDPDGRASESRSDSAVMHVVRNDLGRVDGRDRARADDLLEYMKTHSCLSETVAVFGDGVIGFLWTGEPPPGDAGRLDRAVFF